MSLFGMQLYIVFFIVRSFRVSVVSNFERFLMSLSKDALVLFM